MKIIDSLILQLNDPSQKFFMYDHFLSKCEIEKIIKIKKNQENKKKHEKNMKKSRKNQENHVCDQKIKKITYGFFRAVYPSVSFGFYGQNTKHKLRN